MQKGLVEKTPNGQYQLSPEGLYFVDRLSLSLKTVQPQPKLTAIATLRNAHDEFLFYKRRSQPYIDTWSLPAMKIQENEDLLTAATRAVREAFGTENENGEWVLPPGFEQLVEGLHISGAVHLRDFERNELTIENYIFVFQGFYDGQLPSKARWFDASSNDDNFLLFPGAREVVQYVLSGEIVPREYEVHV